MHLGNEDRHETFRCFLPNMQVLLRNSSERYGWFNVIAQYMTSSINHFENYSWPKSQKTLASLSKSPLDNKRNSAEVSWAKVQEECKVARGNHGKPGWPNVPRLDINLQTLKVNLNPRIRHQLSPQIWQSSLSR